MSIREAKGRQIADRCRIEKRGNLYLVPSQSGKGKYTVDLERGRCNCPDFFYAMNQERFMRNYHKRSNVETTFHMIKAKFGDELRSKTKTAQVNEALCKILCHNVCRLIQSMYELGLKPKFWKEVA